MGIQMADLMHELKNTREERASMHSYEVKDLDSVSLIPIIRKMDQEIKEMKTLHTDCKNLGKTVDELAAVCCVREIIVSK